MRLTLGKLKSLVQNWPLQSGMFRLLASQGESLHLLQFPWFWHNDENIEDTVEYSQLIDGIVCLE